MHAETAKLSSMQLILKNSYNWP